METITETVTEPSPPVEQTAEPPPRRHRFRVLDPPVPEPVNPPEETGYEQEDAEQIEATENGAGEQSGNGAQPIAQAGVASAEEKKKKKTPPSFPGYKTLYNGLLVSLYYVFGPLNDLLLKLRRPRRPVGRPIRVLRIASKISQGGVAKVCLQTMLRIPAERVENHLFIFNDKHAEPASLIERPDIGYINHKWELWPATYNPKLFKYLTKIARLIRRTKPDIIHVHEPQFAPLIKISAGMAGGYRLLAHLHNDYSVRLNKMQQGQRAIQKHCARRSHLIACSQTIYDCAYKWLEWTGRPVALIEDGVDDIPDCPPDETLAADLARAAAGRQILAKMAHLMPHKRIDDFLIACRILLDEGYPIFVLLMCYGKPKFLPAMKKKFRRMFAPEEGEFLYEVVAPQHILNQVSVGISTSSLEGLGLNVLEYQVNNIPVVCTDLIPHREMVTDGEDGLLFPVGDVPALLRQTRRILDDPAFARRLGEAGRIRATRRRWSDTALKTAELYEKIVAQ